MNRPGNRVSAEKGKHGLGTEKTSTKNQTKRALIKQKKSKQLMVDETLFFYSLFARFKTVVPQLALRA